MTAENGSRGGQWKNGDIIVDGKVLTDDWGRPIQVPYRVVEHKVVYPPQPGVVRIKIKK